MPANSLLPCRQYICWSYNKSVFKTARFGRGPFTCSWGGGRKAVTISKLALPWVVVRVTEHSKHGSKRVTDWLRNKASISEQNPWKFLFQSVELARTLALSERLVTFKDHWTLKPTEPWGRLNREDHSSQPLHITHTKGASLTKDHLLFGLQSPKAFHSYAPCK